MLSTQSIIGYRKLMFMLFYSMFLIPHPHPWMHREIKPQKNPSVISEQLWICQEKNPVSTAGWILSPCTTLITESGLAVFLQTVGIKKKKRKDKIYGCPRVLGCNLTMMTFSVNGVEAAVCPFGNWKWGHLKEIKEQVWNKKDICHHLFWCLHNPPHFSPRDHLRFWEPFRRLSVSVKALK